MLLAPEFVPAMVGTFVSRQAQRIAISKQIDQTGQGWGEEKRMITKRWQQSRPTLSAIILTVQPNENESLPKKKRIRILPFPLYLSIFNKYN